MIGYPFWDTLLLTSGGMYPIGMLSCSNCNFSHYQTSQFHTLVINFLDGHYVQFDCFSSVSFVLEFHVPTNTLFATIFVLWISSHLATEVCGIDHFGFPNISIGINGSYLVGDLSLMSDYLIQSLGSNDGKLKRHLAIIANINYFSTIMSIVIDGKCCNRDLTFLRFYDRLWSLMQTVDKRKDRSGSTRQVFTE